MLDQDTKRHTAEHQDKQYHELKNKVQEFINIMTEPNSRSTSTSISKIEEKNEESNEWWWNDAGRIEEPILEEISMMGVKGGKAKGKGKGNCFN